MSCLAILNFDMVIMIFYTINMITAVSFEELNRVNKLSNYFGFLKDLYNDNDVL